MQVKLSKQAWHWRLMKWTFGSEMPEFNNLCPYFWLTIFCILFSPFYLSLKLLMFSNVNWFKRKPKPFKPHIPSEKRDWMMKLAEYTKILVPIALLLIVGAVGFGLYMKWSVIPWIKIFKFLGFITGVVSGILVITLMVPVLQRVAKFCWRPFGAFFKLVWCYLVAAKEGYCPRIEWEK